MNFIFRCFSCFRTKTQRSLLSSYTSDTLLYDCKDPKFQQAYIDNAMVTIKDMEHNGLLDDLLELAESHISLDAFKEKYNLTDFAFNQHDQIDICKHKETIQLCINHIRDDTPFPCTIDNVVGISRVVMKRYILTEKETETEREKEKETEKEKEKEKEKVEVAVHKISSRIQVFDRNHCAIGQILVNNYNNPKFKMLSGTMESSDLSPTDAMRREIKEELGCEPIYVHFLRQHFIYNGITSMNEFSSAVFEDDLLRAIDEHVFDVETTGIMFVPKQASESTKKNEM